MTIDLVEAPAASHSAADIDLLLLRAGAGDQDAFANLYDALAPRALGLLMAELGDSELSERALEDVFVEVWRRAPRRRHVERSAQRWILGLAARRAAELREAAAA